MRSLYSIRNWATIFENSRSREYKKLDWVPIPNKHDGLSYRRLIAMENGIALYAAWVLIVQVASKCSQRGVLAAEDGPLDALDLSLKTGVAAELFEQALQVLADPKIGWLQVEQQNESVGTLTASVSVLTDAVSGLSLKRRERTEENEEKGNEGAAVAADHDGNAQEVVQEVEPQLLEWLQWWNRIKAESLVAAGVSETDPSQGVLKAWKRAKRDKALVELLRDRDAIEREIRASAFCRESWFRLEKLFAGTNKDGEFILKKLIDGAYRDAKPNGNGNRGVDVFRGLRQFVADAEGST